MLTRLFYGDFGRKIAWSEISSDSGHDGFRSAWPSETATRPHLTRTLCVSGQGLHEVSRDGERPARRKDPNLALEGVGRVRDDEAFRVGGHQAPRLDPDAPVAAADPLRALATDGGSERIALDGGARVDSYALRLQAVGEPDAAARFLHDLDTS